MKFCNILVGLLNFLSLLISFTIIGISIYFLTAATTQCEKFLQLPLLVFGTFLMVMSMLGLFGACCRLTFLLWIYGFVMFVLIIAMIAFTTFAFIVTNKGAGEVVSGGMVRDFKLGDYSGWLQNRVQDSKTWKEIEGCLKASKVCGGKLLSKIAEEGGSMAGTIGQKVDEFYKTNLSPIQSGCCKPPTDCGFVYANATFWTIPSSGLTSKEPDCSSWNNDQEKLCYSCNSCKAGVLATLKSKWKEIAIFNCGLIVFLMIVYSVGCCAYRNNMYSKYDRY